MKPCLIWTALALCLTAAVCCEAADIAPAPLLLFSCAGLRILPVIDPEQRIEVPLEGFSILPPQGEHWCYRRLTSSGISFFKLPKLEDAFEVRPSRGKVVPTSHMFGAMAMSLKGLIDLETNVKSPEDLKTLVDRLIREHLFSQIFFGLTSAKHRYQLLESNVVTHGGLSAVCVRFDALVEERGSPMAPDLVFLVNLPSNLVCRHPSAPEVGLLWVGFAERYLQGKQPAADTLKEEYEPYIESLQFMQPR